MIAKIESYQERWNNMRDAWVEKHVLPKLQALLDQAQSRIKRCICFHYCNGQYSFEFRSRGSCKVDHHHNRADHFRHWAFTDAVAAKKESELCPRGLRYRNRFPELVEFVDIVVALGDELGYTVFSMEPTK